MSEDNCSVGGDGDNQTHEKTKNKNRKRRKKQVQAKGVIEKDIQNDEPFEDECENVEEEIITEGNPANKNDLPVQISLPENKLSPSSDIVCVFADYISGAVMQLWSSDNEFTIEFPDDDSHYISNRTINGKYVVQSRPLRYKGQQFCRICLGKYSFSRPEFQHFALCDSCFGIMRPQSRKKNFRADGIREKMDIQLSWMAKYLFRNGYKLLSPCTFDMDCSYYGGKKQSVLYHCFVK